MADWGFLGHFAVRVVAWLKGRLNDQRRARRAMEQPEAQPRLAIDGLFDEAIRELGGFDPRPSGPVTFKTSLVSKFGLPDWFNKDHNRRWLSRREVQQQLKQIALTRVAGQTPSAEILVSLLSSYAQESGENQQHAEGMVTSVLAYMEKRALPSSAGPLLPVVQATAAVQAANLESFVKRLEEQLPPGSAAQAAALVGLADELVHERLASILRRRASMPNGPADELRTLLAQCDGQGQLGLASQSARLKVMNWLARAEAGIKDVVRAQATVARILATGQVPDAIVLAAIAAAQGHTDAALRRLRDLDTPDSRSLAFVILREALSTGDVLEHLDRGGLDVETRFTPVGWRNVCSFFLQHGHLSRVRSLAQVLPSAVTGECAELSELLGVAHAAALLPSERQRDLVEGHPLMLASGRLETLEARRAGLRAVELFEAAVKTATQHGSQGTAQRSRDWLMALRLCDADLQEDEKTHLREAMNEGAAAVHLVGFATAFDVQVNLGPLEAYLTSRRQLGGWDDEELAAWLCLLELEDRDTELIDAVEGQWQRVSRCFPASAVAKMLLEALLKIGQVARAQTWLATHAEELDPDEVTRLTMLVAARSGDDPTMDARNLFNRSGALVDLHNLIVSLQRAHQWSELVPYELRLVELQPNLANVDSCLRAMTNAKTPQGERLAFLQSLDGSLTAVPDVAAETAWTLLRLGRAKEAQQILNRLEQDRDVPRDLALAFNISVQVGAWHQFPSLIERGVRHRASLDVESLFGLARVAGLRSPDQALELVREAVRRRPDDPQVLMSAYHVAVTVGRDEAGGQWMQHALSMSRDDGPVRAYSLCEVVTLMDTQSRARADKLLMLRRAEMPLHMAAGLFSTPLTRLLHVIPHLNLRHVDARRRESVPIRAGGRQPVACLASKSIALDVTTVLLLIDIDLLSSVLDSFDAVWISPRLMVVLLEDCKRLTFHQPSRVNAAKPMHQLVGSGKLKTVSEPGPEELARVIGVTDAALLAAAEANGGCFVHPGEMLDLESHFERPANLGDRRQFVISLFEVCRGLKAQGHITAEQEQLANEQFKGIDRTADEGPDDLPRSSLTHVYLTMSAAEALHRASLLTTVIAVASSVSVHQDEAAEWAELVGTEFANEPILAAVEAGRSTLFSAWEAGKLHLLEPHRDDDEDKDWLSGATACLLDLMSSSGCVDVVCVDDRMTNAHPEMADRSGRGRPIVTIFDLLDRLQHEGRLGAARRLESLHSMRRRQLYCVPLTQDDLQTMLAEAVLDGGTLRETAMLRTLREHLGLLFGSDMLCTSGDLDYLDALWSCGAKTILSLWNDELVEAVEAAAKSEWVHRCVMPSLEVQLRHVPDRDSRWAALAAARASLGCIPTAGDAQRKEVQRQWLERVQLAPLLPAKVEAIDMAATTIGRHLIEQASEIAAAVDAGSPAPVA